MGYEIKLIIGKSGHSMPEHERDMTKPYSDGSGFEYKKDDKGNYVLTGRQETYFHVMAELDLCKIGYDDSPLNKLINDTHKEAKVHSKRQCWYFYGTTDGNRDAREDRYGDALIPVPIGEVLKAVESTAKSNGQYRRFDWAVALLKSMSKDPEKLEVMFWGH